MDTEYEKQPCVHLSPTNGAVIFAGTDVPVQVLIDHLEAGDTVDGFLTDNPAVDKSVVVDFLRLAKHLVAVSLTSPHSAHATAATDTDDFLAEYANWHSHPVPDPRSAPLSEIVRGLVEIIAAEGPMLAYRAYTMYARAFGLQKIQQETKERFTRALRRAMESGDLAASDEAPVDDPAFRFVRAADSPLINERARGDRKIEEVPPLEIAALMHRITPDISTIDGDGEEWLFRMVLERYELIRMTDHTKSVLTGALALAKDTNRWERRA